MSRRLKIALAVLIAGWGALAWLHLYRFSVPWADTWCYLGPAAAASGPLHIIAPYLSTFHHSDQTWGLHFPGGPLLYSLLLGWVPFAPAFGVLLFMLQWAGLALATGLLVARFSGRPAAGALAGAAVLANHGLFDVAQAARPELVAALAVVLLWAALSTRVGWPEGRRLGVLALAAFLCPLLHPVSLAVGAAVAVVLVTLCLLGRPGSARPAVAAAGGYAAGLAALASWFYFRAGAWDQLRDHAGSRLSRFGFGRHFWQALQALYRPLYSGHILWLAGVGFALAAVAAFLRRRRPAEADLAWGGLILASVLLAQEPFQNGLYVLVGLPECVALVVLGVLALADRQASGRRRFIFLAVLTVVLALDGAFWASRSAKFLAAGRPDLRAELRSVTAPLKAHSRLLIPESLWELFLAQRATGVSLNTLPQAASPAYRRSYEVLAFSALTPGDLVVVDRFQAFAPLTDLRTSAWTPVAHWAHVLPGREEWGYDLTVYQKN